MNSLSNIVSVHPLNASHKSLNEEQLYNSRLHLKTIDEKGSGFKQDSYLESIAKKK